MSGQQTTHSAEEAARIGDEIYERTIRARVEQGNHGRVVAIDVNTGDYEVGDNALASSERLVSRLPDAEIWFVRVGHRALHCIGGYSGSVRR